MIGWKGEKKLNSTKKLNQTSEESEKSSESRFSNRFKFGSDSGPQAMTGKRLGGFIFDTMTLHGAAMDALLPIDREVVILEFTAMRHTAEMPWEIEENVDKVYRPGRPSSHPLYCSYRPPDERVNWQYCRKDVHKDNMSEDEIAGKKVVPWVWRPY